MTKEIMNLQIEEELKEEAGKLFSEIGMTVEEAVLIFIKQCLRERRIPFEIRLDIPNQKDNFE
jgi:DNA-damage-inducible protein J